jgi:hypothetical protein
MNLKEILWEDVDWINQVLDRDQWRVFVNTMVNPIIMNLPV